MNGNKGIISADSLHFIGKSLDRLISFDINGRRTGLHLYETAYEMYQAPLTSTAALGLHNVIRRGSPVFIIVGFPALTWLLEGVTETDGPVGAAYLARIIEEVYEAIPIIVTAAPYAPYVRASLTAAGLVATGVKTALQSKTAKDNAPVAGILSMSTTKQHTSEEMKNILSSIQPSAVIAIEMSGRAKDGNYYTFKGRKIPPNLVSYGTELFTAAQDKGILTIGFIDGGNELGTGGKLAETTARVLPNGELIACVIPAHITVAGAISNWGAYGVGAAILAYHQKPEIMQAINVQHIIQRTVDVGAVDGPTNRPLPKEDKVPAHLGQNMVDLMHFTILQGLENWINNGQKRS